MQTKDRSKKDIFLELSKLQTLLEKSNISYRSLSDLISAQEVFIKLGKLLINAVLDVDEAAKVLFYSCLQKIVKRDEFRLHNMAYSQEFQILMKSRSDTPIKDEFKNIKLKLSLLKRKNQVSLEFQKFNYKLLLFCLTRLEIEDRDHSEVELKFMAYCLMTQYFSIPEFKLEVE